MQQLLERDWRALFDQFSFSEAAASYSSGFAPAYNKLLGEYLLRCQKCDLLPSPAQLKLEAEQMFCLAESAIHKRAIDEDRFACDQIDRALLEMSLLPILARRPSTEHPGEVLYLKLLGIVSTQRMSRTETRFMLECFNTHAQKIDDSIQLTLVSVALTGQIDAHCQGKIENMALRKARSHLSEALKRAGHPGTFRYGPIARLRDKWLFSGL